MFKNGNIKTKEIISNDQSIETINAFYKRLTDIAIKVISDNSPIIDKKTNEHLLNTTEPKPNKKCEWNKENSTTC